MPLGDLDAVRAAIRPATKVIWCETPTNPLLGIADIAALAELAHGGGCTAGGGQHFRLARTCSSRSRSAPTWSLHSTTKYIGGHSDVIGGALVVDDAELGEALAFHRTSMGAVPGPFDAWLTLRGVKTLGVRMDRHCDNAERVVELLVGHPAGGPGLLPGAARASGPRRRRAADAPVRRDGVLQRASAAQEEALKVCRRTRLFTLGESLGGVESLIEHPGLMTHASVAGSPWRCRTT